MGSIALVFFEANYFLSLSLAFVTGLYEKPLVWVFNSIIVKLHEPFLQQMYRRTPLSKPFSHYYIINLLPILLPSKYVRFRISRILYLLLQTGCNQLNNLGSK